jgi:hypothetical protein
MDNRYEEGSDLWHLFNTAQEISDLPASGDPRADAIDRLTVALYRIGAAWIDTSKLGMLNMSNSTDAVGNAVDDAARGLAGLAEAVEKLKPE